MIDIKVTEDGTFIPYKIGQVFYDLRKNCKTGVYTIQEHRISGLQIKVDGCLKIRLSQIGRGTVYDVTTSELNDEFYKTYEEAEQAVKELTNE